MILKAGSAEHLAEKVAADGLALAADDVVAIDALDREDGRIGPDPDSSS